MRPTGASAPTITVVPQDGRYSALSRGFYEPPARARLSWLAEAHGNRTRRRR